MIVEPPLCVQRPPGPHRRRCPYATHRGSMELLHPTMDPPGRTTEVARLARTWRAPHDLQPVCEECRLPEPADFAGCRPGCSSCACPDSRRSGCKTARQANHRARVQCVFSPMRRLWAVRAFHTWPSRRGMTLETTVPPRESESHVQKFWELVVRRRRPLTQRAHGALRNGGGSTPARTGSHLDTNRAESNGRRHPAGWLPMRTHLSSPNERRLFSPTRAAALGPSCSPTEAPPLGGCSGSRQLCGRSSVLS
jgi:hypothetical protein